MSAARSLRRAAATMAWVLLGLTAALVGPRGAEAHPLAPALLELEEAADGSVTVAWKTSVLRVPGSRVRPVLPPECETVSRPVAREAAGSVTTRWRVRCDGGDLVGRRVGVEGLASARIDALVRVLLADGRRVQGVLGARSPSLTIPARPSRLDVFGAYLGLGTEHILTGFDHLLFVLGLLLLVGSTRLLVETITAFTLGHSVTLALAVLGLARLPSGPIEVAIALSVLVLAVELARPSPTTWMRRFPWAMALLFGLLHGLGFAGALAEVGLPEAEVPLALLSFNVGIELGQIAFVFTLLLAWWVLRGRLTALPVWSRAVPVYAMGSLAAFWCLDRASALLP